MSSRKIQALHLSQKRYQKASIETFGSHLRLEACIFFSGLGTGNIVDY